MLAKRSLLTMGTVKMLLVTTHSRSAGAHPRDYVGSIPVTGTTYSQIVNMLAWKHGLQKEPTRGVHVVSCNPEELLGKRRDRPKDLDLGRWNWPHRWASDLTRPALPT
ncbi:uncharacterized protein LOC127011724 [Drosophila biarmipes]|uniref:uncharacterized protein LOC127011724 n=1 Tax=Drosophila biarmipes TaxID=125945 RepID=UPI0021CC7165|nr:uncharacterized protein LOC127011724 [Drosophila biarmipes]